MKLRKICVITTSRADYGLLYLLMKELKNDPAIKLQVIASGMHMSTEFGLTYKFIERDGFSIQKKIEMLIAADDESSAIKSLGVGLLGFGDAFRELRPQIVVLLGDRFELLAPVIAAVIHKIPIAHIHGGETSQGAVDEAVRHAITKMASLHFPATEEYRRRIIQMGENPSLVFNFGAPGLDNIRSLPLMSKASLGNLLMLDLKRPTAIVTYHPVTLETNTAEQQIRNILNAISEAGIQSVFTEANADVSGRIINQKIEIYCRKDSGQFKFAKNLERNIYLSYLKNLDLMIGNSSSGLIEAPSFKLPVVNVGDRQKGRIKAVNVIDTNYETSSIVPGIQKALSARFRKSLIGMINPYQSTAKKTVSARIKDKLKFVPLGEYLIKKKFWDIPIRRNNP